MQNKDLFFEGKVVFCQLSSKVPLRSLADLKELILIYLTKLVASFFGAFAEDNLGNECDSIFGSKLKVGDDVHYQ